MLHILGWGALAITVFMIAVNALYMLISPRAWFRLPGWIRANGSLTEKQYASGWGAAQVRITGGMGIAVILWVFYDAVLRH